MSQSKQQAPHFYVSAEFEMDAVIRSLAERNDGRPREDRVTQTAYLIHALGRVLPQHPMLNATWDEEDLDQSDAVNICVAISLGDQGLVAPALIDCANRDLEDVASGLRELADRARAGRLRPAELNDGTFTLSSLGMYPVSTFTAIITPPQVAILAVSRTEPRAVVRNGSVTPRHLMNATVSADHRAVDGAAVAQFLGDLKSFIEA